MPSVPAVVNWNIWFAVTAFEFASYETTVYYCTVSAQVLLNIHYIQAKFGTYTCILIRSFSPQQQMAFCSCALFSAAAPFEQTVLVTELLQVAAQTDVVATTIDAL
jgi:hypothetical protein